MLPGPAITTAQQMQEFPNNASKFNVIRSSRPYSGNPGIYLIRLQQNVIP